MLPAAGGKAKSTNARPSADPGAKPGPCTPGQSEVSPPTQAPQVPGESSAHLLQNTPPAVLIKRSDLIDMSTSPLQSFASGWCFLFHEFVKVLQIPLTTFLKKEWHKRVKQSLCISISDGEGNMYRKIACTPALIVMGTTTLGTGGSRGNRKPEFDGG